MLPKGPIARSTLRTSSVLGLRLIAQAGTLVLLARLLGPMHFGAYAALAALAVLLSTLATFGTHLTLLRDLSQDLAKREQALCLTLGTTALCATLLFALYLLLSFTWLRHLGAGMLVVTGLGVAELLLQPFLSIASTEWHARGQIARAQLLLTSPQLLRLIAAAAVWLAGTANPLPVYALCHMAAAIIALGLALAVSPQRWPMPQSWRLPSAPQWYENSGYAFLNITAAGPTELDKTLAARLLPISSAGVYSAAARVIGALVIPVVAMLLSALPRLFRETDSRSRRLLRWLFFTTASYGFIAGITIWWAAQLAERLFGSSYAGIAQNIRWLALAVPGMALRISSANVLMSLDRPWLRVTLELSGLILLSASAWQLTSSAYPQGLAISVVLMEWVMAITGWGFLYARSMNALPKKSDMPTWHDP